MGPKQLARGFTESTPPCQTNGQSQRTLSLREPKEVQELLRQVTADSARANRHRLAGYVWHLTHRCHRQQFLLKLARDRRAWIGWVYAARKRYGLCVLDYTVT